MNVHPAPTVDASVPGRSLRPLRVAAGVPVTRLAAAAEVRAATVYNWEAGRARIPRSAVPALAGALGVPPEALRRLLRTPLRAPEPAPASPLRRLRLRSGLSQEVVASRVGSTRHTVGSWEGGTPPPLVMLRRLASAYGVPVATVAEAAGVEPPRELDPRRWRVGDLPAVLRTWRSWAGLTQRELGDLLGCTTDAVRGWEAGRGVPSARNRARLERVHRLPVGALLAAYPSSSSNLQANCAR
ncbi:helix-turn-helix domain-containing protein [Nocardioides litoris]|uniref:helix-turn-helix domain-containing protein n=1 Tax=Nocardioides litoris TaxID=1926648 RepID=UPI001476BFF4|nr:helix-turn-helix transcriptional regulator [Nocardioides litoris]